MLNPPFSHTPSLRAEIVTRRSYNRPLNADGTLFETWPQTVARVIRHQRWLWERAKRSDLNQQEEAELAQLHQIQLTLEGSLAGRTLWLGGTEISKTRETSNFNCCGTRVKTVFDIVDIAWLLLQGCGCGFTPVVGVLNGFCRYIPIIEMIRSSRTERGGAENNTETWLHDSKTWIIQIGDSAAAWAKAIGKLIAGKYPAQKLIIDLSQIRPSGQRLRGYGWISSGDEQLSRALVGITDILNRAPARLLTAIEIMDVVNWIGTILSSRRSAELAMLPADHPQSFEFATAKRDHFETNPQRAQSNNSLVFYSKPSKAELRGFFDLMLESGGSEPGLINGQTALKRAPDFAILNPCSEVLLGDKSHCNLSEINLSRFNGRFNELCRVIQIIARANYRQTCVDLRDGILQATWHELNQYLHLCGVGLTGFVQWEGQHIPEKLQELYRCVRLGTDSMAEELDMPYAKRVSTCKPSGTLSKIMDCTEGVHKPLGKYIFNNINFSKHDPIVSVLQAANYYTFENPYDSTGTVVRLPVCWNHVEFDSVNGLSVNIESAVTQLERYRMLMENYVDQNVSITVSYDPSEISAMVDWLDTHWESHVATAFLLRNDPTKTAADLGYPYLPQEVVTQDVYNAYIQTLRPVNLNGTDSLLEIESQECAGGHCPMR